MKSRCVSAFVLIVSLVSASLSYAENVIGLPEPIDPNHPGAVMLHGGGRMTDEAFDRFIELAGGPKARIIFVPSAGFSRYNYKSDTEFKAAVSRYYSSWTNAKNAGRIADFQILHTDNNTDCFEPRFFVSLNLATGVWFSGGAQSRLNYRYVNFPKMNPFQTTLRNVIERGGVVGGTSAGMAAAPEIMTVMDYRPNIGAPADAYVVHGLALFDRAIVEQHFDARSGRLERFTSLLKDTDRLNKLSSHPHAGENMIGLASEESTAIVVRGNQIEIVGKNHAHVFLKSNSGRSVQWNELKPGEIAQLQSDKFGKIHLLSENALLQR